MLFIFTDYWSYHLGYALAFKNFQHAGLTLFYLLLVGGAVGGFVVWKKRFPKRKIQLNGLSLATVGLLLGVLGAYWSVRTTGVAELSFVDAVNIFFRAFGVLLAVYIVIIGPWYVIGTTLARRLRIGATTGSLNVIRLGLGITVWSLLLFFLGTVQLLRPIVLFPLILLTLGVGWRTTLTYLRDGLWTPISHKKDLSGVGVVGVLIVLLFLGFNFLQIQRPFPFGFDSLALYSNLPALISGKQGLVPGFQPYYWSLIMAQGFVLFNLTNFNLVISFLGVALSVYAMFHLGRRWLNTDYAWLGCAVFVTIPAINFQSYKDMKIDMGLLFVSLSVVLLFLTWIDQYRKQVDTDADFRTTHLGYAAGMGLMLGLALGIKFTAVFLLFATIGALWYVLGGRIAFIAVFLLSVAAIFLAGVDNMTGLRSYHLGVRWLTFLLLPVGLVLFGMAFVRRRDTALLGVRISVMIGLFLLLTFLPWPVKNYVETRQVNFRALVFGEQAGAKDGVRDFERSYRLWKAERGN